MELVEDFQRALSLEGLRPSTVYHYVRDARRFCLFLGDRDLAETTPTLLRQYLTEFRRGRKAKTLREAQIALRRFFRWLVAEGLVGTDPTTTIRLAAFRTEPQATYTAQEIRGILTACNDIRDRALVMVLYDTGCREGELVSMGAVDFVCRKVKVIGKTGIRNVPLGAATIQVLRHYTRAWGIDGTLWLSQRGRLTESGVVQLIRRLCHRAGVPYKGVHAFRRAAAAQMKRLGMNDSDIMEICGWKSITMLRRYTAAVNEELAQRAHDLHSPADNL